MQRIISSLIASLLAASTALCGSATEPQKPKPPAPGKAKVLDAVGMAQKRGGDTTAWTNLNIGDLLTSKSTVKTGEGGAVLLQLPNRYLFRIGEKTTVDLKQIGENNEFSFNVISGKVWNVVRGLAKPTKYEVQTPSAVVGVSGTVFSVFYDENESDTTVSAAQGLVNVAQGGQTTKIAEGTYTRFRKGGVMAPMSVSQSPELGRMWKQLRAGELSGKSTNPKLDRTFDSGLRSSWQPYSRMEKGGKKMHGNGSNGGKMGRGNRKGGRGALGQVVP